MSNLFESLESRMFLSVSPLVTTLHTDEAATKADLVAIKKAGATAIKTIGADLKAAMLQVTDKAQLKALKTDFAKYTAAAAKILGSATGKVNADVNKLEAVNAALVKKPGNATLTAKQTADVTALNTEAGNEVTAFSATNGNAVVADANAIIADGGTVATDTGAALTALSNDGNTLSTAFVQAFMTDVAAIVGP